MLNVFVLFTVLGCSWQREGRYEVGLNVQSEAILQFSLTLSDQAQCCGVPVARIIKTDLLYLPAQRQCAAKYRSTSCVLNLLVQFLPGITNPAPKSEIGEKRVSGTGGNTVVTGDGHISYLHSFCSRHRLLHLPTHLPHFAVTVGVKGSLIYGVRH